MTTQYFHKYHGNVYHDSGIDCTLKLCLALKAVSKSVCSCLGPKSMKKILVDKRSQDIIITSDGATILKLLDIQHPAPKYLVSLSKLQDSLIGDGTTSIVLFTTSLFESSSKFITATNNRSIPVSKLLSSIYEQQQFIHSSLFPSLTYSFPLKSLNSIISTCLATKSLSSWRNHLVTIIIALVLKLKNPSMLKQRLSILKRQVGSPNDSFTISGLCFEHSNHAVKRLCILGSGLISSDKLGELRYVIILPSSSELDLNHILPILISALNLATTSMERSNNRSLKIDLTIISGTDRVFSKSTIPSIIQKSLGGGKKAGLSFYLTMIMAVPSNILKNLCSNRIFPSLQKMSVNDLKDEEPCYYLDLSLDPESRLLADPVPVSDESRHRKVLVELRVKDCLHESLVLCCQGKELLEEIYRSVWDGLALGVSLLNRHDMDGSSLEVVAGGGSFEFLMSCKLRELAEAEENEVKRHVLECFAEGYCSHFKQLLENAGLGSREQGFIVDRLKTLNNNKDDKRVFGVDLNQSKIICPLEEGLIEPVSLKKSILELSTQAVITLLRIDEIFISPKITPEQIE